MEIYYTPVHTSYINSYRSQSKFGWQRTRVMYDRFIQYVSYLDPSSLQAALVIAASVIGLVILVFLNQANATSTHADVSVGLKREQAGDAATASASGKPLNPAVFKPFVVTNTTQISHNTKLLRFAVPGNQVYKYNKKKKRTHDLN